MNNTTYCDSQLVFLHSSTIGLTRTLRAKSTMTTAYFLPVLFHAHLGFSGVNGSCFQMDGYMVSSCVVFTWRKLSELLCWGPWSTHSSPPAWSSSSSCFASAPPSSDQYQTDADETAPSNNCCCGRPLWGWDGRRGIMKGDIMYRGGM